MIRADRRAVLKGSAALAALGAPAATASARPRRTVTVFDSRLPESASFAASRRGARMDVALGDGTLWADLRRGLPATATVEGLTGWSDWAALRSELEGQGFRLSHEQRLSGPLSGRDGLFRWAMKAR